MELSEADNASLAAAMAATKAKFVKRIKRNELQKLIDAKTKELQEMQSLQMRQKPAQGSLHEIVRDANPAGAALTPGDGLPSALSDLSKEDLLQLLASKFEERRPEPPHNSATDCAQNLMMMVLKNGADLHNIHTLTDVRKVHPAIAAVCEILPVKRRSFRQQATQRSFISCLRAQNLSQPIQQDSTQCSWSHTGLSSLMPRFTVAEIRLCLLNCTWHMATYGRSCASAHSTR